MSERTNRSDCVRRDLDPDLIALQVGKGDPLHSVEHLHLAVLGLNLGPGGLGECGSRERSIDRMFPAEQLRIYDK